MPLDGLTLNVLVQELDRLLKNGRVIKIYQPDDRTVTLQLRLPGKNKILLISADPLYSRIHTILEQPENPLNPPAFCMLLRKYLEPSRILKIEQKGFDRICHLRFEGLTIDGQSTEYTLVVELMGRRSNLYLVDAEGMILDSLKRFPDQGVMPGQAYRAPSDQGKVDPTSLTEAQFLDEIRLLPASVPVWKWIIEKFQGFSKVAAKEVLRRAGFDPSVERGSLKEAEWPKVQVAFAHLLRELEAGGNPTWYLDQPKDFAAYHLTGRQGEHFASANQLIQRVLGEGQEQKKLQESKSRLRKQLANHYKRIIKKAALQETTLQEAEQADSYRHQGELLTASFHLLSSGQSSIEVPDYTQEGTPLVKIALDQRLTPSANVQRIFKRYAKAKASQKYTSLELQKTRAEEAYLESILLQIELADQEGILKEIENELAQTGYLKRKTKPSARKTPSPPGPERYLSVDGLTILVGRNNQQNERLTFALSKPNHLWLHARNIPGSHVAVLSEEEVPPSTLLQAAQLAAYFSQSRTSPKVPVDYTLRKHVRKPRGASPGFVNYGEARTILVNPTDFQMPQREQ